MKYYESNLKLLKGTSEILYNTVMDEEDRLEVAVEESLNDNGCRVLYMKKKVSLHSVYDVDYEMENTFSNMAGSEKTVIMFGIGDGHGLKYIKSEYSDVDKIIVVEPSLELFKRFLENNHLMDFVSGISVSFIVNKSAEATGVVIGKYLDDSGAVFVHYLSYRILFEEYYIKMMEHAKKWVMINAGNYSFQYGLNKKLVLNFISNLKYGILDHYKLKEVFRDKPIIVVAAGPSLDKNIHLLHQLKDKAIILAVGSAIKILEVKGITPHLRMAFDPSEEEMKVLEGVDTEKCPIIYDNNLFYGVLAEYKGKKLLVNIVSDYGQKYFLGEKKFKENLLETGTSVLIPAVDMGVRFGSSKIIFIGVDFSITEDKVYADGFDEGQKEKDRAILDIRGMTKAEGINGETVYMNRGFVVNKMGLEAVIAANKNKKFIDATEGGVKIEGAEIMTLQSVLDKELANDIEIGDLNKLLSISNDEKERYEIKLNNFYEKALQDIELIKKLHDKKVKKVKKLIEMNDRNDRDDQILEELKHLKNEDDYAEIPMYADFILPSLNSIFASIQKKYRYQGFDKKIEVTNELKKVLGCIVEIDLFIDFVKTVIRLEMQGKLERDLSKSWPY